MSDLFKAGKAKHTKGGFSVATAGGAELVKRLQKLENGGKVAIQRTVSDFAKRAPAWVSKEIRQHYGVDAAAIKESAKAPKRGRTSINVSGITVDGATLVYKGRTLTPTHFKMSPKARPTAQQKKPVKVPGQIIAGTPVAMVRPPKRYTVKATIIKGKRTSLGTGTFITEGNGGVALPFQKKDPEHRGPIEAVRTLSVPQMIDGRAREGIERTISEKLGERFEHHIKQATK